MGTRAVLATSDAHGSLSGVPVWFDGDPPCLGSKILRLLLQAGDEHGSLAHRWTSAAPEGWKFFPNTPASFSQDRSFVVRSMEAARGIGIYLYVIVPSIGVLEVHELSGDEPRLLSCTHYRDRSQWPWWYEEAEYAYEASRMNLLGTAAKEWADQLRCHGWTGATEPAQLASYTGALLIDLLKIPYEGEWGVRSAQNATTYEVVGFGGSTILIPDQLAEGSSSLFLENRQTEDSVYCGSLSSIAWMKTGLATGLREEQTRSLYQAVVLKCASPVVQAKPLTFQWKTIGAGIHEGKMWGCEILQRRGLEFKPVRGISLALLETAVLRELLRVHVGLSTE